MRGLADELQQRLSSVVRTSLKGRAMDIRPEPERVCPRGGCAAMTAGVLLAHTGGGCTAVALVSGSGKAPTRLVPWAGAVTLKSDSVAFREYPESAVTLNDAVPCDELLDSLAERQKDVAAALQAVAANETESAE